MTRNWVIRSTQRMKERLSRLGVFKWTMDWGMQFNIPKCKALHVGRNNHNFKYYINKIELQNVNEKET